MKSLSLSIFLFITSCAHYDGGQELNTNFKTAEYQELTYDSSSSKEKIYFPLKKYRISRGFSPYGSKHFGVDFVAPLGTSVYAAHNGKVIFAGKGFSGYGNLVIIEHPDGIASFYAHLHRIQIQQGELVSAHQIIGQVGRTGRATGVHLHFELKIDEKAVDPQLYLQ